MIHPSDGTEKDGHGAGTGGTSGANPSASSHYALHVALHTLKERCRNLQKRLATLEDENLSLRLAQTTSPVPADRSPNDRVELEALRDKVAGLNRQNSQLAEHITMVATENRQLWSRVSQLTKEPPAAAGGRPPEVLAGRDETVAGGTTAGQNLIRSKTFTKNAPNPKLRERLPREGSDDELHLEDVSLLSKCGFLESDPKPMSGYLLVDEDASPDMRKCTEEVVEIQQEIARQQVALRALVEQLRSRQDSCQYCSKRQQEPKPVMLDKTVAVAEADLVPPAGPPLLPDEPPMAAAEPKSSPHGDIDILQEKVRANGLDKMCPICGKVYGKQTLFDVFQEHVEGHFLDDDELDGSLDRTCEYISHAVGNF